MDLAQSQKTFGRAVLASALTILCSSSGSSSAVNGPLFLPPVTYDTGAFNPVSVVVADVNGDGAPDLVVANQCSGSDFCVGNGSVGVLLGNGHGTFQLPATYASGGSFLNDVAVADVNGDGKPDVIAANGCANIGGGFCSSEGAIGVLLGNGDGTFQTAITFPSGGFDNFNSKVAVADVNGDGRPDIVVMNGCSSACNPNLPPQGSISILLGTGTGAFNPGGSYASGGFLPNRWQWAISTETEHSTWSSRTCAERTQISETARRRRRSACSVAMETGPFSRSPPTAPAVRMGAPWQSRI
jgi:VCBS repeat protein